MRSIFIIIVLCLQTSVFSINVSYKIHDTDNKTDIWKPYSSNLNLGLFHANEMVLKIEYNKVDVGKVIEIRNFYVDFDAFYSEGERLVPTKVHINDIFPNYKLQENRSALFIKLKTQGMFYVPVNFFSHTDYQTRASNRITFYLIVFTVLILCSIICLIAKAVFKNNISLFCFLYLISSIFLLFTFSGLLKIWLPLKTAASISLVTFFALSLFHVSVLFLSKKVVNFNGIGLKIFNIILLSDILFGVLCFVLPIKFGYLFHNIMPIVLMLFVIYFTIVEYKKSKSKSLIYYLFGWCSYYVGAVVLNFLNVGTIHANFLSENAIYIGSITEAVTFIVAIFIKVKAENVIITERIIHPKITVNAAAVFSEREKEVVELLVKGYTNKKIADELFVSTNTIKFHLTNIYSKCGVTTKSEAISKLITTSSNN
jgi:two-component system, sensor histidine kinase LadS